MKEEKDEASHLGQLWGLVYAETSVSSGEAETQAPSWGPQVDRQSATKPTAQTPQKDVLAPFLPFLKSGLLQFFVFPMKDNLTLKVPETQNLHTKQEEWMGL